MLFQKIKSRLMIIRKSANYGDGDGSSGLVPPIGPQISDNKIIIMQIIVITNKN